MEAVKVYLGPYPEKKDETKEREINIQIDEWDTWNVDITLSKIISNLLRKYEEKTFSFPAHIDGIVEWKQILNAMIYSFEEVASDYKNRPDGKNKEECENYNNKLKNGIELFAKYFFDLWD